MILSLSHKFLFIHVYKVTGTSIVHALGGSDVRQAVRTLPPEKKSLYLRSNGLDPSVLNMSDHAFAKEVRNVMDPSVFNQLYKFGFVRNPWDMQLLLYKYNLACPQHRNAVGDFSSFERFIMSASDDAFPSGQQKRFLFDDDGKQLVDFIGRYESLEDDFRSVCTSIGVGDIVLEHRNATTHAPWATYYTRETFEKVRRGAVADIAAFGYDADPAAYAIH